MGRRTTPFTPRQAMRQYELRWAELPAPIGRRPVLLLTRSAAYEYLSKVIIAEVTTTIRGIPQELVLWRTEGMSRKCVVNLDNIHVVLKAALRERIGALPARREPELKRALGYALDWAELKTL
jgi:mRNA interferase MazF